MDLKYAFKLIFLKCIFEFMKNSDPPTSNSVHGREKCFKDDNVNGTIIRWLLGAMVKDLTSLQLENPMVSFTSLVVLFSCSLDLINISHGHLTKMDLL